MARHPRSLAAVATAVLLATLTSTATAAPACHIDDAYADFAQRAIAQGADRLQSLHAFAAAHAPLYTRDAIGIVPGPEFNRVGLQETARIDERAAGFDDALHGALATATGRFAAALPDFRCDFIVYLAPTFGRMDGAGRVVAGKPALVLGPSEILSYQTPAQLPVFLAHELFHRYHHTAAGFSDDLAEREVIWRALWAEGLATYASAQLNPDRPLADALLIPRDLAERAGPFVPAMARELGAALDAVDARTFARFFDSSDASARQRGRPTRSGYYVGYLVARRLAQRHSLQALAHLQGSALRQEIGAALAELARTQ